MTASIVVRLFVDEAEGDVGAVLERAQRFVAPLGGQFSDVGVEPYPPMRGVSEASFRWSCDDSNPVDALRRVIGALGGSGWKTLSTDEEDGAPSATWSAGAAPVDPSVRFANLEATGS